ncbi:MAG: D-alanine--D-alanine ligase [Phycisphaerae bacterium]|nr:D-alanine--D-alanine ligase [Phycisphaerae bacterium]
MRVAIVYDQPPHTARPDELDTLIQVRQFEQVLRPAGHEVAVFAATLELDELREALRRFAPDRALNLCEGLGGHARLIHVVPALLEAEHIPYAGCGSDSILQTSNKLLAKRVLSLAGVATPPWFSLSRDACGADCRFPGRYIVKSVWEHSSVGLGDDAVVSASDARQLAELIASRAARLGGEAFAECFIDGREFNVSLLAEGEGVSVLPVAEIAFQSFPPDKPRIVNYAAKWDDRSHEYHHTPRRFIERAADPGLYDDLARIARAVWRVFALDGWVRVDFRVDHAGRPWVLEINANPCLSLDAGFMAAAERAGLSFEDVAARIMESGR